MTQEAKGAVAQFKQVTTYNTNTLKATAQSLQQINRANLKLKMLLNKFNIESSDLKVQHLAREDTLQKYDERILEIKNKMKEVIIKRQDVARTVNVKILKKIDIQKKLSPAHEVFRWCLAFLYNQNVFNYFFYNFVDEALSDQEDFLQRLSKVSAFKMNSETAEMTSKLVKSKFSLITCEEFDGYIQQIQKLIEVASLVEILYNHQKEVLAIQQQKKDYDGSATQAALGYDKFINMQKQIVSLQDRIDSSQALLKDIAVKLVAMQTTRVELGKALSISVEQSEVPRDLQVAKAMQIAKNIIEGRN